MCVHSFVLLAQAIKMKNALELLKGVGQDEEFPVGLAETAEDLASADVMNHPVRTVSYDAYDNEVLYCCNVPPYNIIWHRH